MTRALARPLTIPWRKVGIAAYIGINGALILHAALFLNIRFGHPGDYHHWQRMAADLAAGTLYTDGVFVWSPIAAWAIAHVVLPLGYPLHVAANLSALLLLPGRAALAVLASWPFAVDLFAGNFFVYVAVVGLLALRGSRWASIAYFALCLLMPRPVQLPLLVWLLWRDRSLVGPFVGLVAVNAAVVLWTGYADEWAARLVAAGHDYPFSEWDIGPTRFLGSAWLVVGIPLAAWLTMRGRVGWAGLVISPYLVPQYLLVLLWELRAHLVHQRRPSPNPVHRPLPVGVGADAEGADGQRLGPGGREAVP